MVVERVLVSSVAPSGALVQNVTFARPVHAEACHFRFLSEDEQTWLPPAGLQAGHNRVPVLGSLPVRMSTLRHTTASSSTALQLVAARRPPSGAPPSSALQTAVLAELGDGTAPPGVPMPPDPLAAVMGILDAIKGIVMPIIVRAAEGVQVRGCRD